MHRMCARGLVCSLLVAAWSCASPDTGEPLGTDDDSLTVTVTFAPTADARVEEATPGTNFGSATDLKSDGSPRMESVLRFTVTGLSGTVTSAKLRLDVNNATVDGPALYATTSTWSESSVTWTTRPAPVGSAIADTGNVATGWLEIDVSSRVVANGTYDFLLTSSSSDGFGAYAREGSAPPQLVVTTSSASTDSGSGTTDGGSASADSGSGGSTGMISIAPVADTRVEEATPTVNYGTAPDLKSDTSPNMQSYLRFDVTGLSGTVTSARLRLDVSNPTTDAPAVYLTTSSWGETSMTWSTRPAPVGSAIADLGSVPTGWVEYDVTRGVTGNGSVSFVLVPVSSDGFAAYSRETSTPPALIVTTSGSSGTDAGSATDAGPGGTDAGSGGAGIVIAAAGDVACQGVCGQDETATLVTDVIRPSAVLGLGDYQYEIGTLANLMAYYDPYWGRFKSMTYAINGGSHDYYGTGDYLTYFNAGGPRTLAPEGSYSFDLGDWHIIALDSYCFERSTCDEASWTSWLRADLEANRSRACTLAYLHQPYWTSSGRHARLTSLRPWIDLLYSYGVEVLLQAHQHWYERFAPQTPSDAVDTSRGIVAITVGTGGKSLDSFGSVAPNSVMRSASTFGVLRMTLRSGGYDFAFVPAPGSAFTDSGTGTCH